MRRSVLALAFAASTLTASPSGLFHPLWNLLFGHWGGSSTKAGAGMDPRGLLMAPQPSTDAGPGADPWGRSVTTPQPTTDEGAGWDPWG
jgi:hypothetical protein